MRPIVFSFLFVVMFVSVEDGLANSGNSDQSGFLMSVIDIPCKDVINSIPTRLKELSVEFEWTDVDRGLLTVGPFLEKARLGFDYSSIRQTYFLKVTCDSELMVNVSGEATLEGLQSDGEWIGITDSETVDQYSLEFFDKLDL
jgi:hypothetical protein